jgi:hypothetical protein
MAVSLLVVVFAGLLAGGGPDARWPVVRTAVVVAAA